MCVCACIHDNNRGAKMKKEAGKNLPLSPTTTKSVAPKSSAPPGRKSIQSKATDPILEVKDSNSASDKQLPSSLLMDPPNRIVYQLCDSSMIMFVLELTIRTIHFAIAKRFDTSLIKRGACAFGVTIEHTTDIHVLIVICQIETFA